MMYLAIILPLIIIGGLIFVLYRMIIQQRWFGVPFVRTKHQGIDTLVEQIKIEPGQVFVDLGCGDGIVMDAILRHCPGAVARGYELDPQAIAQSQQYQLTHGSAFSIIQGDYFQADISDADIVYCYLLPRLLPHVWKMITAQCKPGTIVYSYIFAIPDITQHASHSITIADKHKDDTLFTYIV